MSDSEVNGNVPERQEMVRRASNSMEDLSEYTDADESISAPTEILAEFLYAIMTKDYQKALRYCTLILSYEPNNSTAKEFYPLILEKLELMQHEDEDSSSGWGSSSSSSNSDNNSTNATTASFSSLMDDEADVEHFDFGDSNLFVSEQDADNGNVVDGSLSPPQENNSPSGPTPDAGKPTQREPPQGVLIHPTPTTTFQCSRLRPDPQMQMGNEQERGIWEMSASPTRTVIHPSPTITFPSYTKVPNPKPVKSPQSPSKNKNKTKGNNGRYAGSSDDSGGKRKTLASRPPKRSIK